MRELLARLVGRELVTFEAQALANALAHELLNLRQILRRQWTGEQEVVVEAIVDDWSHAELHIGEELQDAAGEQVGERVAEVLELVCHNFVV